MSALVAHLTSVHPRHDTRIYYKMCKSVLTHGFRVVLVVADGNGDAKEAGLSIHDVGESTGRIYRMWVATRSMYQTALSLNADLYHLHDPELMPTGLKLKRRGKRVVFDAHEDLPKQILAKPYLDNVTRRILASFLSCYEAYACKYFDGVIAATPFIKDKFSLINRNTVDICNFPTLSELCDSGDGRQKQRAVCYVGGLSQARGITEIITAVSQCRENIQLNLCGQFESSAYEQEVRSLSGWSHVNALGHVGRAEVRAIMGRSIAGLVTLHPLVNYLDALPVKMFEYMSAGIPVIASDFPLWREIVAGNDCGLLVNPLEPTEIAKAIDELAGNLDEARRMGQNGRKAVEERYNWGIEERKLLALYENILGA